MKIVRIFSIIATIHQIIGGYLYFLKQSVKYENENNKNLYKLQLEHKKQIQVQKMSSLGEMASGISHEINNPLMVILGKSNILRRHLHKNIAPDDVTFSHLDKIDSMIERIAKIIEALKTFSKTPVNDVPEKKQIDHIIELTLDLCRERFASAGITLEVRLQADSEVNCRISEISQVILNLLNNAYDAVKGREGAWVGITSYTGQGTVEILVQDNGPGISPENLDKIMQPFFTTKDIGQGSGLGLSVSQGIIEAHQGSLQVIPTPQKTTFQVLLPLSEA